jgi:hypothetical protein
MPGQVSHKGTKYKKKIYFVVSMALWVIRQFIINMTLGNLKQNGMLLLGKQMHQIKNT